MLTIIYRPFFLQKHKGLNIFFRSILLLSMVFFSSSLVAQQDDLNEQIDSLLRLNAITTNDTLKVEILQSLGDRYARADTDSAIYYLNLAVELDKARKVNPECRTIANTLLGACYAWREDYEKAQLYLFTAYEYAKRKKLKRAFMINIVITVNLFDKTNAYTKRAIELVEEGLEFSKNNDISTYTPYLYHALGNFVLKENFKNRAYQMYWRALHMVNRIEPLDEFQKAVILKSLGSFHFENNQLDSAIVFINQAIEINRRRNNTQLIVENLASLSRVYTVLGDFNTAKALLAEALKLGKQSKKNDTLQAIYRNYQRIFLLQKDYNNCIQYGKKGLSDTANQRISPKKRADIFNLLCECYTNVGDVANAIAAKDSLMEMNRLIFDGERAIVINETETKYKLNEVKAMQKIQAEYIKRSRIIIAVISGLVILLAGVAIALYRLFNQRRGLTRQLKEQNQELAQKNEELSQLDRTKTRFFSNISHELKTPLTLIINPIRRLLKKEHIPNQDFYLLKSAETNSIQLFDLTNQILELTKFDVNRVDVNETTFNFYHLLSKTYADFESLAVTKKIDFKINFQGNQDLTILSDSYKIYTILKNLISNAIKFSNEGDTILIKGIEHENELEISISDTGQGIHESDLPNIFDRYYQAKISKKFVGGGTGIGLSLCQEYVKLLGGSISATSEYLKGSQFTVRLPKKVAAETIATNSIPPKPQKVALNTTPKERDIARPSILLVEDNLSMQSYLNIILSDNFHVIIANHGKEALAILEKEADNIQLIISDIMMPVMNGHELLDALKAHTTYASIPVVMLTALSDTDDKLKALRVGIDDYLVKPFVDEELLVRVDNLINNVKQRKAYRQSLIPEEAILSPTDTMQIDRSTQQFSQKDIAFLELLEEQVLANYKNTNFSVESLALYLKLSRAQTYRRIKSTTGLTPRQYIDQVRFQEAKKLLEKNQYYTIKAVAFSVGFKDEKNFAKNFKKRFGKNPSAYLE